MKDFIKYTFASLLGFMLAGTLLAVLGIALLTGFLLSSDSKPIVKEQSVFVLRLQGTLQERVSENPLEDLLGDEYRTYGLDDILLSIQKAKDDPSIKGIFLETSYLSCSYASIEEIREALQLFKNSGKFLISYADQYTQNMYFLASVADKVIINPSGTISWHGLSSQPIYYTDLLKKLGIDMQIFKVGTYKSAVEPFTATEMSEANREQTSAYLYSIWTNIVQSVANSRRLTPEQLNLYANEPMDFKQATDYKMNGMVDTIMYKDEVISLLKDLSGKRPYEELNQLSLKDMIKLQTPVSKDTPNNTIAVYYAFGDIDDASASEDGIHSEKMAKDLRELRENPNIQAIVLRVNSPGGSAFGAEQIWNEVQKTKKIKPIVVSMGDYAASGGYYISCAADCIIAHPTTLTGSIGIFGMMPNLEGLMSDKLGLHFDMIKTNRFADIGNFTRPFNQGEKEALQNYINNGYKLFLKRCADGRQMSIEDIEKLAEGRVWTGETAQKIGLVDKLGGLNVAIQIAAEQAKIDHYHLAAYPEKENFLFTLLNERTEDYIHGKIAELLGSYANLSFLHNIRRADPIQARLPFEPGIN